MAGPSCCSTIRHRADAHLHLGLRELHALGFIDYARDNKRNQIAMVDGWRTVTRRDAPQLLLKAKYHRAARSDEQKQSTADTATA